MIVKQTKITKHWPVKGRDEHGQHPDTFRACGSQQPIQPARAGVSWHTNTTKKGQRCSKCREGLALVTSYYWVKRQINVSGFAWINHFALAADCSTPSQVRKVVFDTT